MYVSLYENRNRDREKDIVASPSICQLTWDKTNDSRDEGRTSDVPEHPFNIL